MKKAILVMLVAVLGTVSANAQFTAGSKTLSANLSGVEFNSTSIKGADDAALNFTLGAKGSYYVIDNLAIVAGLGFQYEKQGEDNANAFTFTVGAKYHLYNGLYAALAYEGAKASVKVEGEKLSGDLQSFGRVELGYDAYITENVFFEPAIYFKKGFGDAAKDISQFGLSLGIGVNF